MKKILALLILLTLVVSVFAACKKDEPTEDPGTITPPATEQGPTLEDAKVVLRDLYSKKGEITSGDFDVVASIMVGDVKFTVTWATDSTDVVIAESTKDNAYLVDIVPTEPDAEIPYVLTATITATDGSTITTTFNYKVPKFQVNTYAEYVAAEADAPLVVEGVVYGIMSKAAGDKENSIFVQDLNGGGYYVYALADDPSETGIEIGYTVRVKGVKAIYNGTLEIKNASVEIRSTEKVTVTPTDLTAAFTAASTASNANLLAHLGEYVVIKGVTVLEAGSNGYYYFELDGVKTYVRISSSSNCTTKAQEDTIIANHAAKFYYTADVAGIASIYQGNFYIMPVDDKAFDNFSAEMQPLPDDVKVNMVKDALTLPAEFATATPYTLPLAGAGANFSDVAIAWALAETTNATLVEGVLTPVLPESGSVNITLTATITKNNASVTKEFTIAIKKLEITSITAAVELAAAQAHNTYTADKYMVEGVIAEIKAGGEAYGNLWIADAEGNRLYVYGVYTSDGVTKYGDMTGDKPKVGDKVVLYGVLGTYNTDQQMKSGWLISWEHVYTKTTVNATCKDDGAHTYTCACGHSYTETIPAGEHNYVDGVCSACGVANHEHTLEATSEVVAPTCLAGGYTVYKCTGCTYTENKDATEKIAHADANGDFKCDTTGCTELILPADGSTLTIAQALAIGALTTTTQKYYVTGKITSVYNTTYGNMYITDGTNTITVYGLYFEGARYDAMTTKPVANDTITVYGILTAYNGVGQFKNAELTAHVPHTECTEFTEATCTKLAECVVCGKKVGDYAEHNMVDGACTNCTYTEGGEEKTPTSVSKTHNDIATIAGVTAGQNTGVIKDKQIALNEDITIVCAKGTATSDPCIYSESIRLYQGGATITVKAAEGCEMTTIVITIANASGDGPIEVTGGTADNASAPTNNKYTITVTPGVTEVTIKCVGTDKNSRLYISNIEVNYNK